MATVVISKKKSVAPVQKAAAVQKLLAIEAAANQHVVGRSAVTRLFILSLAARSNMLLLGPPGTAKTMTVERVTRSLGGRLFSILLTKFTKPMEVFGPPSMTALKDDRYEILTEAYLPTAVVGILDEIFKGSSAILNALLELANERTFRNGTRVCKSPLRTIVGMSNEFPEDPALLAAFFDRFPLKLMVRPLDQVDFDKMIKLMSGPPVTASAPQLTDDDIAELDALVTACEVPPAVQQALIDIRLQLAAKGVAASDRRYAVAIRILRAAAVLAGRKVVALSDLGELEKVLWNNEPDIAVVAEVVGLFQDPLDRQIKEVVDEAYHYRLEVIKAANLDKADSARPAPDMVAAARAAAGAHAKAKGLGGKIQMLQEMADTENDRVRLAAAETAIKHVVECIRDVCLGNNRLEELRAIGGGS